MEALCIALNIRNSAPSQYLGYNFNSLCEFNDQILGAGDGGIFQLDTGSLDDTTPIEAYVEWVSDLGIPYPKHVRRLTVGCKATGELLVTTSADGGPEYVEPLLVDPTDKYGVWLIKGRRTCRGRYLTIRIGNVDGAYFSIDQVTADVTPVNIRAGLQ